MSRSEDDPREPLRGSDDQGLGNRNPDSRRRDYEADLVRQAVAVVRDQFEKDAQDLGIIVRMLCYAHLGYVRTQKFTGLRKRKDLEAVFFQRLNRIPGARAQFELTLRETTPAAGFRAYWDAYVDALNELVDRAFKHLFEAGCAHEDILPRGPVDFAVAQVEQIIRSQRKSIVGLIRRVCPDPAIAEDDQVDGASWQAPRFLLMRPAMHLPFNGSRAWEQLDNKLSRKLVEDFASKAVTHLEDALKETAGDATLQVAKRPPTGPPAFRVAESRYNKARPSRSGQRRHSKNLNREERERQEIIFKALLDNLVGEAYCKKVDNLGGKTPVRWQDAGCPSSYQEAYRIRSGPWKKRIQDEKTRMRVKLKSLR
jgi:hypothetical protein